jgi:hypothetical protein
VGAIAGRPRGDAVGGSDAEGTHPVGPSGPVMGMDLGGTYLRAALTDEYGRIVLKRRVETLAREGREAVLERIIALLNEVKGEAGRRVAAVGVGAPGPLDPEAGIIRGAWTLPGWEDVPLRRASSRSGSGSRPSWATTLISRPWGSSPTGRVRVPSTWST